MISWLKRGKKKVQGGEAVQKLAIYLAKFNLTWFFWFIRTGLVSNLPVYLVYRFIRTDMISGFFDLFELVWFKVFSIYSNWLFELVIRFTGLVYWIS